MWERLRHTKKGRYEQPNKAQAKTFFFFKKVLPENHLKCVSKATFHDTVEEKIFVEVFLFFNFSAPLRLVLVVITSSTCCDITKTTLCLVCACFSRGLIPSVLCQRLDSITAAALRFPFTSKKKAVTFRCGAVFTASETALIPGWKPSKLLPTGFFGQTFWIFGQRVIKLEGRYDIKKDSGRTADTQ